MRIMRGVGLDSRSSALYLNEAQLSNAQVEQVSNFLNNGDIPNLFVGENKLKFQDELAHAYIGTPQEKYAKYLSSCKQNLHVIFCMNPLNSSFRARLRLFPALVNCTTIDWFEAWPEEALLATAKHFIPNLSDLPQQCVNMH